MAFMTHASWDFMADARGYTYGAAVEWYWDDWAVRFAHTLPPKNPNQLPVDFRFWQYFGDQLELEHDHTLFGLPGAVRLLGYRNRVNSGSFDDAIATFQADPTRNAAACVDFNYGSQNAGAPDLCWVRKDNVKVGIGLDVEQFVAKDIGVFLRAMWSDGQTEVVAFNAADRSLSFGAVAPGLALEPALRRHRHRPGPELDLRESRPVPRSGRHRRVHRRRRAPAGHRGRLRALLQPEPLRGDLAVG